MSAHVLRSSFNAGEISPLMDSRMDAEQYKFACRKLENFVPRIYGGAFRRPGRMYLGDVGDETKEAMIIPFNVSASERYILELGHQYLRVWNDSGTQEIDRVNSPYTEAVELTTPYNAADLFDLKFVQLNNVCFFTHPLYPVQKFEREFSVSFQAFSWSFSEVDWSYPCFRSANQTDTTASPSGTTGSITVSFSSRVFDQSLDVTKYYGSEIQIVHRREEAFVAIDLNTTRDSSAIKVLGDFTVYTYGTWDGTLTVQRKDAAGAWEDVRSFTSDANHARNIVYESFQPETAELRLSFLHNSAGSSNPRAVLELEDSRVFGRVRIDSITYVSNLPVATCTVLDDLDAATATTHWALEAWAGYSGYPRAVTFHEQRLWFGGTELEPNTFWASAIDDFTNFRRGAYDADSLAFTLAAQEGSAIQSMLSHEALVIFTQTEEWTAVTSEQTAITASNIFVRRQSRFGSAYKQAFLANNNIIFLQRGLRKLREFQYTANEAGGVATDLSVLAEHVTLGGVKQIAFQQQPDPVLWLVTETGELISLTYESTQNVIAWARHPSVSTVESVAVIYGDAGDQIWMVVKNGDRRSIERLNPEAQTSLDERDLSKMVYVDSAVVVESEVPVSRVKGLQHINGLTVSVLVDGVVQPDRVVTNGEIQLDEPGNRITVGLPYTSTLQPSKIELALEDGTSEGRKFLCKRVWFQLRDTLGIEYADSPDAAEDEWKNVASNNLDGVELFTGRVRVNNYGAHRENVDVTLRQRLPLPCNVLAMIPIFDVMGD